MKQSPPLVQSSSVQKSGFFGFRLLFTQYLVPGTQYPALFRGRRKVFSLAIVLSVILFLLPQPAWGMHISEGFLPARWCLLWYVIMVPFLYLGTQAVKKNMKADPRTKILIGIAGAFVFVLSALKLPSVTGSSSHLTGTGLGTIMFGPWVMSVVGVIVLLFQVLLLAHGGITTLGANVFSMGIAGPLIAYAIYMMGCRLKLSRNIIIFLAASFGDLFTYVITSLQLALAFPDSSGGVAFSFAKFAGLFAITQVPLAIIEGIITVIVFNVISKYALEQFPGVFVSGTFSNNVKHE
jgi:cobalt/nickel transport system permease protein